MINEERVVGLTEFQCFIVGSLIIFLDLPRLFDFLIQLFVGATSIVSLKFHPKQPRWIKINTIVISATEALFCIIKNNLLPHTRLIGYKK